MTKSLYEKSEHEKELLRLLARGDREIETGEGYDDVVWIVAVWHDVYDPGTQEPD